MIVKGDTNPEHLDRCLWSILPHVDGLCLLETWAGDSDAVQRAAARACREFDVDFRHQVWKDPERHPDKNWISDFSVARNKALEMLPEDATYWCWIDADTELVHGDLWKRDFLAWIDGWRETDGGDHPRVVMRLRYDYDHEGGACIRRASANMVVKKGYAIWQDPVHEQVCLTQAGGSMYDATRQRYHLRHFKDAGGTEASSQRNLWIIGKYADKNTLTGPFLVHWGTSYLGVGAYEQACAKFEEALVEGGLSKENHYRVLVTLGTTRMELGDTEAAESAYGRAIVDFPNRATPWCYLASLYNRMERWEDALVAAQRAREFEGSDEGGNYNPAYVQYAPLQATARALEGLGNLEAALGAHRELEDAMKAVGQTPRISNAERIADVLDDRALYESFKRVAKEAGPAVWLDAPRRLAIYPEVAAAQIPQRPLGIETVMIWCGPGGGSQWGPSDLATGIGGSEEAVIFLSRELVRQGYHVEVYAMPHREEFGVDDHGVVWAPHFAWEDKPGIFVEWRGWRMLHAASKARLRFCWLHDKVYKHEFPDSAAQFCDGVFCLTEFHAKPFLDKPLWLPKVIQTTNGLDPAYFPEGLERVPRSFAYYSSPDRGLDRLLDVWPEIRYALPDATLDIFYGFTSNYLRDMRGSKILRDLKRKIDGQVEDLQHSGVRMLGMVGQDVLARSMATTAFWLYPTAWPETSCITSMKAQALGCIPITSRYPDSGVPETTKYDLGPPPRAGSIYDDFEWLSAWKDRVIEVARMPEAELPFTRQEMMDWARETYSWAKVAAQWSSIFQSSAASAPREPHPLVGVTR